MEIAILLYDGVEAVEALGPHAILSRLPGAQIRMVSKNPGPQIAHEPALLIEADLHVSQVPRPDIVMVPGGFGEPVLVEDATLLDWIRTAHATTTWTMASSTGSVLLAAAGILDGVEATTHWLTTDILRQHGARPVSQRVVEDGRVITAIGGAAALEMSLVVVERVAGPEAAAAIRRQLEAELDAPFVVGKVPSQAVLTRWWEDAAGDDASRGAPWWRRWWRRRRSPRRTIIKR